MVKQRVIIYVDGFNFYYGLKSNNWKKYYWLDIVGFFKSFLKPHQELVEVIYFSATPYDKGKYDRQDLFFSANKLNAKFRLELGRYLPKVKKCIKCGNIHKTYEEKETDVKIATRMISDVVNDRCDISILVSADSDLTPPIHFIQEHKVNHKIFVYFPPKRFSSNLNALANSTRKLDGSSLVFAANILPEELKMPNGYVIKRPNSWK